MKAKFFPVMAVALLLIASALATPAAASSYTLQPGTSAIPVGNEIFSVTTDQTIVLDLAFLSPGVVEGSVDVANGQTANVRIFWRKAGLTIFDGRVIAEVRIRYLVPQPYQAQEDVGHTEK